MVSAAQQQNQVGAKHSHLDIHISIFAQDSIPPTHIYMSDWKFNQYPGLDSKLKCVPIELKKLFDQNYLRSVTRLNKQNQDVQINSK